MGDYINSQLFYTSGSKKNIGRKNSWCVAHYLLKIPRHPLGGRFGGFHQVSQSITCVSRAQDRAIRLRGRSHRSDGALRCLICLSPGLCTPRRLFAAWPGGRGGGEGGAEKCRSVSFTVCTVDTPRYRSTAAQAVLYPCRLDTQTHLFIMDTLHTAAPEQMFVLFAFILILVRSKKGISIPATFNKLKRLFWYSKSISIT